MDIFNSIFNWLGDKLEILVAALVSILPTSPFSFLYYNQTLYTWLGYLNYFLPIYTWIAILQGWISCIAIYYAVSMGLRWVKAIK